MILFFFNLFTLQHLQKKKNATYNATLTLQQLHYSAYNKVLRLIILEVYNIYIKKVFFVITLHRDAYRHADAQLTPLQV